MFNTLCGRLAFIGALLALLLTLSGCDETKPPVVQEGIVIEDEVLSPYTEGTRTVADATLLSLLTHYYGSTGKALPDETALAEEATRLRAITEEHLLAEEDYLALLEILECEGEALTRELAKLSEGGVLDFPLLKRIYLSITDAVGAEYLGDLTHSLILYLYDCKYEEYMTLFEATGKVYQKVKAQQCLSERTTFAASIDKADTRTLLTAAMLFGDLALGGVFDEGGTESFTDEELLLFLKHLDLSSLTVGEDGWLLLFTYAADYIGTLPEIPYGAKLLFTAVHSCDDAEELAARMGEVMALLSSIQQGLDAECVGYLRKGEHRALTEAVFARMTEDDFALLEHILSITPHRTGYHAVALEYFGETYTAYADAVTVCTLAQLRAAVGTEGFYPALEGYLAAISPAFSFLIRASE